MSDLDGNKRVTIELLKLYAEGLVSPHQAQEIEAHLERNETDRIILQGLLSDQSDLTEDSSAAAAKFDTIFGTAKTIKPKPTSRRILFFTTAIAAVIAIFFLLLPIRQSAEKIISSDLQQPYKLQTFAGNTGLEDQVRNAYQEGDFQTAYSLFEKIDPEADQPQAFYKALSALYSDTPEAAIKELRIIQDSKSAYKRHATWFLGLALFEIDEREAALQEFSKIQPSDYRYEKAQVIIKRF